LRFLLDKTVLSRLVALCAALSLVLCQAALPEGIAEGKKLFAIVNAVLGNHREKLKKVESEPEGIALLKDIQLAIRAFYHGIARLEQEYPNLASELFNNRQTFEKHFSQDSKLFGENMKALTATVETKIFEKSWGQSSKFYRLAVEIQRDIYAGHHGQKKRSP
jgi:hypothetical protein